MNTQNVNQQNAQVPAADLGAAILHQQLALHRLKELEAVERMKVLLAAPEAEEADKPEAPPAILDTPLAPGWGWLWRSLARAGALLRPAQMMREVAPGYVPVAMHEIERVRELRALQLL